MSQNTASILQQFLDNNHFTHEKFCEAAGISRFSLYKYLRGSRIHPKTAKRIEQNLLENTRIFLPHEKLID